MVGTSISLRMPSDTFFLCPLCCVLNHRLLASTFSALSVSLLYCLVAATCYTNVELARALSDSLCVKNNNPALHTLLSANDTTSTTSKGLVLWPAVGLKLRPHIPPANERTAHFPASTLARGQYLHSGPLVLSQLSPSPASPAFADLGSLVSISILP